jgi:hypothetical protein
MQKKFTYLFIDYAYMANFTFLHDYFLKNK